MSGGRGFTLIELLVTTSIVVLLLGTGMPAFRQFGRVQQLNLGADQVKSTLLNARGYALNPRAEEGTLSGCKSSNYTIAFTDKTYQIWEGTAGSVNSSGLSCLVSNASGQLPSSIHFSTIPDPISFIIGSGRVASACPANGLIPVVVYHDQIGKTTTRTISVNCETGAVSITNP